MYIVGSSAHPGGGVMAAPGANAAREILRTIGKGQSMPDFAA
jgi:phytoene dehydrogenase-like protein